jgi:hypothetical protein
MTRKEEYHNYLKSPEWKAFRKLAFEHYGRKCSECDRTKTLQIHHKTYDNIFNEKLEDVVVLCEYHHKKVHGIKTEKPKQKKLNKTKIPKEVRFRFVGRKKKKNRQLKSGKKWLKTVKPAKTQHPHLDEIFKRKLEREAKRADIKIIQK